MFVLIAWDAKYADNSQKPDNHAVDTSMQPQSKIVDHVYAGSWDS